MHPQAGTCTVRGVECVVRTNDWEQAPCNLHAGCDPPLPGYACSKPHPHDILPLAGACMAAAAHACWHHGDSGCRGPCSQATRGGRSPTTTRPAKQAPLKCLGQRAGLREEACETQQGPSEWRSGLVCEPISLHCFRKGLTCRQTLLQRVPQALHRPAIDFRLHRTCAVRKSSTLQQRSHFRTSTELKWMLQWTPRWSAAAS